MEFVIFVVFVIHVVGGVPLWVVCVFRHVDVCCAPSCSSERDVFYYM